MARFYIITEFGDVFSTDSIQDASGASYSDTNYVIDSLANELMVDGKLTGDPIDTWECAEEE